MKEFLLIYRADWQAIKGSPEEMQARTQKWIDWTKSIDATQNLVDRGNRLQHDGMVLRGAGMNTDGPYTETKEYVGGYSLIRANSYEEAARIAKGCPALAHNGSVEIREISKL